jgi:hypothetical protein
MANNLIQPTGATGAVATATPTIVRNPAVPATTTQSEATRPAVQDSLQRPAQTGSVPGAGISFTQTVTPTAAPPALNLAAFLQGFQSGQALSVDGGAFVSGSGKVNLLRPDFVQMKLDLSIGLGPFSSDKHLYVDVMQTPNGYKMRAPEQWDLKVTQTGNHLTLTNKANASENIQLAMVRPGEMKVTFDGHTITVKGK